METSESCWSNCTQNGYKCVCAVVTTFITTVFLLVLLIVCVLIPSVILTELYHNSLQQPFYYIALVCIAHMFLTCLLLLYGLIMHKSWCVLVWIITMSLYWNVHLIVSVVSVVMYVMEEEKYHTDTTSRRTIFLFFEQVVWLFLIVFMWYYWKKMNEENDVANLVEYVTEQSSSLMMMRRNMRAANAKPASHGSLATRH